MQQRPPPPGFVDLREVVPHARFSIGYHTPDNFTGAPLPGYGAAGAWLLDDVATDLITIAAQLADQGLGLLIFDAYRPRRATVAMVAWCQAHDAQWILDQGYVSARSRHNTGNAIDLTLYRRDGGQRLDMGTAWDSFCPASHLGHASGRAADNRALLQCSFRSRGWQGYSKEWWHFNFVPANDRPIYDVPYGLAEVGT